MKSPIELLQAFLTDVSRLEPDVKGINRDRVTINARFEHEGIGFLSVALSSLRDAIDYGLAAGRFTCPSGFKTIRKGALPRLFSGLLCEVFEDSGVLRGSPNVRYVRILREALSLYKKYLGTKVVEKTLHDKATRSFWDNDAQCDENLFDSRCASLLARVSRYTLASLDRFERLRVRFRHGPGAVVEGHSANQKWSAVNDAIREGWRLATDYGFDGLGLASIPEAGQVTLDDPYRTLRYEKSSTSSRDDGDFPSASSCHTAKLITVPKNSTSRRTITVEPVLNMFIQQGLNTELRDSILLCPVLSECLALSDQSVNQRLAMEGSITGKISTLDLKSASDLLSLGLVKLVFSGHASFLDAMLECRSSHVVEDNCVPRLLRKFAGMGNALTFPVQSVVFACVAITAILVESGLNPTYRRVKSVARLIQVYGDDIVVPTESAHQVIKWLTLFGLQVNQRKSFTTGYFRESCGVDAFMGINVTPTYVRHEPSNLQADPSALAAYVSLSNQFWLKGLYACADTCRRHVEESLGRTLPHVSPTSGGLGWVTRGGETDIHRWNQNLHRYEVRTLVVLPCRRRDKLTGVPALLKSLLTPLIERSDGHLDSSVKRYKTRIALRWIPA